MTRTFRTALVLATIYGGFALPAKAAECRSFTHETRDYVLCEVTAGQDDLRLWHSAPSGKLYGSFSRIDTALAQEGKTLGFAMNAGMYHPDRRPVGLYVEDGRQGAPLVTSAGPGNFGMLPNGVFCVGEGSFAVIELRAFAQQPAPCRFASQSGPMLVIGGELHPRFLVDSDSRHIRNGVGVSATGERAVLAISDTPVTFHEFGRLFRDALELPNALYFDGKISRLYAPDLGRNDSGWPMGPIIGLAVPAR